MIPYCTECAAPFFPSVLFYVTQAINISCTDVVYYKNKKEKKRLRDETYIDIQCASTHYERIKYGEKKKEENASLYSYNVVILLNYVFND